MIAIWPVGPSFMVTGERIGLYISTETPVSFNIVAVVMERLKIRLALATATPAPCLSCAVLPLRQSPATHFSGLTSRTLPPAIE